MDNMVYRDIVASKALCEYDAGGGMEQSLEELRRVIILADTDEERLNRFLTMGGIFIKKEYMIQLLNTWNLCLMVAIALLQKYRQRTVCISFMKVWGMEQKRTNLYVSWPTTKNQKERARLWYRSLGSCPRFT